MHLFGLRAEQEQEKGEGDTEAAVPSLPPPLSLYDPHATKCLCCCFYIFFFCC